MRLVDFLTSQKIRFERLPHEPAFTSNRIAHLLRVRGTELAKSVLLRTGHGYVVAVLPASHWIDLFRVEGDLHEDYVGLAAESDMAWLFPDCERGAMCPFGSLYDLPTLVDKSLATDADIVFEGQDHQEAIRMAFRDFLAVEHPQIGHFARHN